MRNASNVDGRWIWWYGRLLCTQTHRQTEREYIAFPCHHSGRGCVCVCEWKERACQGQGSQTKVSATSSYLISLHSNATPERAMSKGRQCVCRSTLHYISQYHTIRTKGKYPPGKDHYPHEKKICQFGSFFLCRACSLIFSVSNRSRCPSVGLYVRCHHQWLLSCKSKGIEVVNIIIVR